MSRGRFIASCFRVSAISTRAPCWAGTSATSRAGSKCGGVRRWNACRWTRSNRTATCSRWRWATSLSRCTCASRKCRSTSLNASTGSRRSISRSSLRRRSACGSCRGGTVACARKCTSGRADKIILASLKKRGFFIARDG